MTDKEGKVPNRLGVDTGGTFTDFIWLDSAGGIQIHKQLSTADDPSKAVLQGIELMKVADSAGVVHGSTVATNTILERKGAKTALITTEGFADVLAIGRQNRPDLYALVPQKPKPLVPQKWRLEIKERVSSGGEVLVPLDFEQIEEIFSIILDEKIQSVAVCLLFSFLKPDHEEMIRQRMMTLQIERQTEGRSQGEDDLHISLSSEVLPEYREFERTSTTVLNAYVAPLMAGYLRRMSEGIRPRTLSVMQSNGGITGVETAAAQAARTVLSGPAGGVVGARFAAQSVGIENIITFDMGGTSTDVALCEGKLPMTIEGTIDSMPLRLPMIDIHTVGAGGGSLARVDPGGALYVGPESAGADPGPACYPRERISFEEDDPLRATTTDANLVLGRLDSERFLGGGMILDRNSASHAIAKIARQIGAESIESAALDIIRVANASMERAIRRISIERGYDPRRFTLVAYGGAGPLHACELAQTLQIPRILITKNPGVLSALGMLAGPPTKEYSRTVMTTLSESGSDNLIDLAPAFAELEGRMFKAMLAEGHTQQQIITSQSFDMRYVGQSFELRVAMPTDGKRSSLASLFLDAHFQRYGYRQPNASIEIVNVRVTGTASFEPPVFPTIESGTSDPAQAIIGEKEVFLDKIGSTTKLYSRSLLKRRNIINGPAIIFQYDTTIVIPSEWQAVVDKRGNLIIELRELNG